jgi:hypothetical protein
MLLQVLVPSADKQRVSVIANPAMCLKSVTWLETVSKTGTRLEIRCVSLPKMGSLNTLYGRPLDCERYPQADDAQVGQTRVLGKEMRRIRR